MKKDVSILQVSQHYLLPQATAVHTLYHAPQWYEMHTGANFEKLKTHIFSNKYCFSNQ